MAVDAGMLLAYLDCSFAVSTSLRVVDSREAYLDIELVVELCGELGGKLRTAVAGDMTWGSVKAPNHVNVCLGNIGCCPGRFCWKVVLYLCKPVCNNENCVEPF